VILAGNKEDLLPYDRNILRLKRWLYSQARERGISVIGGVDGVHIISAITGIGTPGLLKPLKEILDKGKDVMILGATNGGKSSLANKIRPKLGVIDSEITTSPYPGTTLGTVPVTVRGGRQVIDSPGLPNDHHAQAHLTPEELLMVFPTSRVVPRLYRITPGKSVLFAGLARVDILTAAEGSVNLCIYASRKLLVHPTSIEKADILMKYDRGTKLQPPITLHRASELPLTARDWTIIGNSLKKAVVDLVFLGIGWIAIATEGEIKMRTYAPKGVEVTVRDSMMPFEVGNTKAYGIEKHGKLKEVNNANPTTLQDSFKHPLRDIPFQN